MKHSAMLSLALVSAVWGEGLSGKTSGYLRLGVQHHDQQKSAGDLAIGGLLKQTTAEVSGLSAGIGFYTVQGQGSRDNVGIPFYDNDNHNYSLLGEFYLQGKFADTTLTVGRQVLDTPFADSDDVGMVPNLFEAFTLKNNSLENTTLLLAHVTKMAGVDAPNASKFTKVNGDDGIQILGCLYEGIEDLALSGWYYHANDLADMVYLDGNYEGKYNSGTYQLGVQYALQDHDNGDRANIYGLMAQLSHEASGLTLLGAYNKVDSKGATAADNFFGGGPFYTSDEHLTLAEAGVNGKAFLAGLSYEPSIADVKGVTLSLYSLRLKGEDAKADEVDMVINYAPTERYSVDLIYSDAKDRKDSAGSFKNLRIFANYHF